MAAGQGFQFTPMGIVPIGDSVPNLGETVSGGIVRGEDSAPVVVRREPPPRPTNAKPQPARVVGDKPMTGKQIASLVRARLREVEKQLAAMPALERERDSLRALLAAASPARKTKGLQ